MADGSTDAPAGTPAGTPADSPAEPVQPEAGYPWPTYPVHRPVAKVVVKADLLPAVSVLSTVALLGLLVGWFWSMLAPGQKVRQVDAQNLLPLTAEDYHRFDDLALFGMLALAAGVVAGVGVWFLRERRGPVVLVAAVLGGLLGGWLGTRTGVSWAQGRFPVAGAPKVGDVFTEAPRLESVWVILAWPMATALVYGVLAAWNSTDDLGRRLG